MDLLIFKIDAYGSAPDDFQHIVLDNLRRRSITAFYINGNGQIYTIANPLKIG